MKILLIGGTRFVGRYLAEDLLGRGHQLTLFHRGETNPGLFPEVDRVLGDRRTDLDRLGGRSWDVVVDTCGYVAEDVQPSVELFVDKVGQYVFVSSAAVYEPTTTMGIDEGSPVQDGPEPPNPVVWWHTDYARNKVRCEGIVLDAFGASRSLIIRPGMIMGPHDPVWYFPYWVVRMLRGGEVLAPGDGNQPLQFIDARDLASFTGGLIDRSISDVFTVDGPSRPLSFASYLEQLAELFDSGARLIWVDQEWLLAQELDPPWLRLPYWLPDPEVNGYCGKDNSKAIEHGLTFRPLARSAEDVRRWYELEEFEEREGWVAGLPPSRGLAPEAEASLLQAYSDAEQNSHSTV